LRASVSHLHLLPLLRGHCHLLVMTAMRHAMVAGSVGHAMALVAHGMTGFALSARSLLVGLLTRSLRLGVLLGLLPGVILGRLLAILLGLLSGRLTALLTGRGRLTLRQCLSDDEQTGCGN
jgi:hypothetical protein